MSQTLSSASRGEISKARPWPEAQRIIAHSVLPWGTRVHMVPTEPRDSTTSVIKAAIAPEPESSNLRFVTCQPILAATRVMSVHELTPISRLLEGLRRTTGTARAAHISSARSHAI